MLKKITKLQSVGLFQSGTPVPADFDRVTLLYAENGRGKSTLAALLRACALGDAAKLQAKKTLDTATPQEAALLFEFGGKNTPITFSNGAWNATVPQIVVFDAEFVEHNVYSGQGVRPEQRRALLEFALGDQAVKLQKKIGDLTKKISEETTKRGDAEKRIASFSQQLSLAQFIALTPIPDAQQQINALFKRIDAAKNAAALSFRQAPTVLIAPAFDTDEFFAVLAKKLADVEKDAEAVVRQHFAKHPVLPGIEAWASTGQSFAGGDDCPFCGQKLEGLALIEAYKGYFNQAYAGLKRQVGGLAQRAATDLADERVSALKSQVATNTACIEAWKDQFEITPPLLSSDQLTQAIAGARAAAIALAAAKQGQPLDAFGTAANKAEILERLGKIGAAVTAYNEQINATVNMIDSFKKKLIGENVQVLQTQVRSLEIALARQHSDAIKAVGYYQTAEAERRARDDEKKQIRAQLDQLMVATLEQYQLQINQWLGKFAADFTIEQMKPNYQGTGDPRTEYGLRLRDRPVPVVGRKDIDADFGSTLSEGDKRTLAFAFFLARITSDRAMLMNQILVLDDPVCSLDRNRRALTVEVLAELASKCAQMIVLSHDAYFVRELRDMLAKSHPAVVPRIASISRVQGDYSAFAACDIEDLCASDYYRHHRQLTEFVAGTYQGNIRDVAKAVRLFLEGFYHRRFPGLLPTRCTFGKVILAITQAPVGTPISCLQPRVDEMTKLNIFAGRFHHDTNPGNADTAPVTDGELKPYVQRALSLVYQG